MLLEAGADATLVDARGDTAADIANHYHHALTLKEFEDVKKQRRRALPPDYLIEVMCQQPCFSNLKP
jgi:hypothetical protein